MNKATTTPGFLGVYFSFLWGRDSWRYPAVTSFLRSSEFCAIKAWFSERSSAFKALCREARDKSGLGKGSWTASSLLFQRQLKKQWHMMARFSCDVLLFHWGRASGTEANNFGACWTLLEGLHSLSSIPHFLHNTLAHIDESYETCVRELNCMMAWRLFLEHGWAMVSLVTMVSHQQAAILKSKMENKTWQTPMLNLRLGLAHAWRIYIYIMYDCVCNWWLFIIFIAGFFLIIIAIAGVLFLPRISITPARPSDAPASLSSRSWAIAQRFTPHRSGETTCELKTTWKLYTIDDNFHLKKSYPATSEAPDIF